MFNQNKAVATFVNTSTKLNKWEVPRTTIQLETKKAISTHIDMAPVNFLSLAEMGIFVHQNFSPHPNDSKGRN